tara:strand:- start:1069 stop:1776 length:708 start_codon:yes stop_codon:yes gene_type:complete
MITKLTMTTDTECFFDKQSWKLKPITLLVGDQGCGKSTLIDYIRKVSQEGSSSVIKEDDDNVLTGIRLFDLEHDNPRTKDSRGLTNDNFLSTTLTKFGSHGEALQPILSDVMDCKNTLILLDEPETSLSLRSQLKFIQEVKVAAFNGCQIIMATHCMEIINEFPDNILNLETGEYMNPRSFKKLQSKPSDFKDIRDDIIIKRDKCSMGIACKCANATGWYDRQCENHHIYEKRRH